MVPFPISSSTKTRHEWNRLDYWANADGRSLRVDLDRCPVTGPGLVYLTPGGGEITASDTNGEVIFAAASTLTHQVFNGSPNMNRAYFRLRHQ